MTYLILCIISTSLIYVIFKLASIHRVKIFPIVVLNYFFASLLGYFLVIQIPGHHWLVNKQVLVHAAIMGICFVLMFFVIGYATGKIGLSITSLATRVSLVMPVLFSVVIDHNDELSLMKIFSLALGILGIVLISVQGNEKAKNLGAVAFLPILLFIGSGFIDSFIKYVQYKFVTPDIVLMYTATVFGMACLGGLVILSFQPKKLKLLFNKNTLLFGSSLGFVNLASIFFILYALNSTHLLNGNQLTGSSIFGINNLSIVIISSLIGLYFFKERLSLLKWVGMIISTIAVIFFILAN